MKKYCKLIENVCIVCKKDIFKTKNERLILKSVCSVCNNKKSRFISKMKDMVYYQVLESELL